MGLELSFAGDVVEWRGPAPHHFVPVPDEESDAILDVSADISYGWGCIPVVATIGSTDFTTSLIPRDDRYLVPVKVAVRRAEGVELGDRVTLRLRVG